MWSCWTALQYSPTAGLRALPPRPTRKRGSPPSRRSLTAAGGVAIRLATARRHIRLYQPPDRRGVPDREPRPSDSSPAGSRCCLFIRREALRRFGLLDPDFRDSWHIEFGAPIAANGWQNRLACDTYVAGAVAADADGGRAAEEAVSRRYPGISDQFDNDRRRDVAAPFRFAITARLMASSDLPVIVMVTHYIGGGVRRHIDEILTNGLPARHTCCCCAAG